ncbi:MAG: hypothetical protein WC023_14150, partial [Rhodocyclaceae bacterium]
MPVLDDTQTARAIKAMEAYLSASPGEDSKQTPVQEGAELDLKRRALIAERLLPVLAKFLDGSMQLTEFKPEIDRINKQNALWGFKGIKGQMFFNLIYNACLDENELVSELKSALTCPADESTAKSKIRNFASYVRRIGEDHVAAGNSKASRPKPSSIPFFLSYFWQVQEPDKWPVFYTNSVQVLSDLNLYQQADDLTEAYIDYTRLHVALQDLFSKKVGKTFTLYDVEHVWWHVGQEKQVARQTVTTLSVQPEAAPIKAVLTVDSDLLPDSYVPPIVGIIPRLAFNDGSLDA